MTVSAVGKALAIFAAFDERRQPLSLSELAAEARLPLSTTHRVVGELARWGALERDESGAWRIGMRLWGVANSCAKASDLAAVARPFMSDLYEVTREHVQLAVREGRRVVFVDRAGGSAAVPLRSEVGGALELTTTGAGLVLLAHAPHEVQEEVLGSRLIRHTDRTVTDPRVLRRMLAEVRRSGYAVCDRQASPDAVAVAAPIVGPDATVVAALSVVVRGDGPGAVRGITPTVRAAARAISRGLGAPETRVARHLAARG